MHKLRILKWTALSGGEMSLREWQCMMIVDLFSENDVTEA